MGVLKLTRVLTLLRCNSFCLMRKGGQGGCQMSYMHVHVI